jgi:quinol monooxygenase YgiN
LRCEEIRHEVRPPPNLAGRDRVDYGRRRGEQTSGGAVAIVFGLVVRFEPKDARSAEAFDRLVTETGEFIRTAEPGTLMYVVNRVDGAPLSRLFYEVYADRPHSRHTRRRRTCVASSLSGKSTSRRCASSS